MKCNRDCFNCTYKDCITSEDDFTIEEFHLSQSLDKDIVKEITPNDILKRRKQRLDWYHRNRDTELIRQAEYREANREKLREKSKEYHIENRDTENQRHLANYYANHEENKKKAREKKKAKWKENPEYYRQKQREYRQRVKERKMKDAKNNSK